MVYTTIAEEKYLNKCVLYIYFKPKLIFFKLINSFLNVIKKRINNVENYTIKITNSNRPMSNIYCIGKPVMKKKYKILALHFKNRMICVK